MIKVEACKMDPIPMLRAGVLSPEQVKEIAPGFINWNPATGSYPGIPGRMGWQSWKVRMQGPAVIQKSSKRIFASLDEEGQINPVLLWARWGHLLIAYGGTRTLWAYQGGHPLKALIVDHDEQYTDWRPVRYEAIHAEYNIPPQGVVPMNFGWKDGEDYVLVDAREWGIMTPQEIEAMQAKQAKQAKPKRKRRTKAEMEAARAGDHG